MWPVVIWTAVVSLSIGFVMGATFRQYRPIKKPITVVQNFHNPNMSDRMTDKQRARLAR